MSLSTTNTNKNLTRKI